MGVAVDPKTGNPLGNVPQVLQFQNNFIPAQATTAIQYGANLPTVPVTTASPSATAGTITAAGGLNPADFSQNPEVAGTPATPFGDSTVTGAPALNEASPAVPISASTTLSGTAPSNSLTKPFSVGDSITVDGKVINFVAPGVAPATPTSTTSASFAGAGPFSISTADTVGTLLGAIGTITGVAPTIDATNGAITLHTGTAQNLTITSSSPGFAALGFNTTVTAARTGGGTAGTGFVIGNDVQTFDNESISGGAVTVYNAAGTPINIQLRWAKTDSASLGNPHVDTWNLFYQNDPNATGSQVAWTNVGTNFIFNANGSLTSPTGSAIQIPGVTVGGQSLGALSFNISSGALTQFASTGGAATIGTITQNGFAAGQLQSVAINNSGLVVGTFSNGQNIDLASITLSHFNGTNYLKALDGGAYAVTDQSGPAIIGASGSIAGSSLEGSNTDIADEFTKLIVTQQAYSANTKVITTANDMVQSLLNVLR
jgi:flagellar hook protein FlgE